MRLKHKVAISSPLGEIADSGMDGEEVKTAGL